MTKYSSHFYPILRYHEIFQPTELSWLSAGVPTGHQKKFSYLTLNRKFHGDVYGAHMRGLLSNMRL